MSETIGKFRIHTDPQEPWPVCDSLILVLGGSDGSRPLMALDQALFDDGALHQRTTLVLLSETPGRAVYHRLMRALGSQKPGRVTVVLDFTTWDTASHFTETWRRVRRVEARRVRVMSHGHHLAPRGAWWRDAVQRRWGMVGMVPAREIDQPVDGPGASPSLPTMVPESGTKLFRDWLRLRLYQRTGWLYTNPLEALKWRRRRRRWAREASEILRELVPTDAPPREAA